MTELYSDFFNSTWIHKKNLKSNLFWKVTDTYTSPRGRCAVEMQYCLGNRTIIISTKKLQKEF